MKWNDHRDVNISAGIFVYNLWVDYEIFKSYWIIFLLQEFKKKIFHVLRPYVQIDMTLIFKGLFLFFLDKHTCKLFPN